MVLVMMRKKLPLGILLRLLRNLASIPRTLSKTGCSNLLGICLSFYQMRCQEVQNSCYRPRDYFPVPLPFLLGQFLPRTHALSRSPLRLCYHKEGGLETVVLS